ncbi:hypothetical protein BH11BAC6_BH11BAC6_03180 [soil metagenome]
MPGRTYTAGSSYRYGFNGKEGDADMDGNNYDYGFRIYNPRIGRFLSVDPITIDYPELTPYQFASNTPIQAFDLDGLEARKPDIIYFSPKTVNETANGIENSVKSTLKGLGNIVAHPIDFITNSWKLGYNIGGHPIKTYNTINRKLDNGIESAKNDPGKFSGKVLGNAIMLLFGAELLKGGVFEIKLSVPQGLSKQEFAELSKIIRSATSNISEDLFVQGSRASNTAAIDADIDFAITVDSKKFDELITKAFGNPKEGSAKWKTMQNAIETGKIQSGEAGLRKLRKELETLLRKDVDISLIKKGGKFDNGHQLPLPKSNSN